MRFAQPQILWLAGLALAALAVFFIWAWRQKRALIAQFVQSRLLASLTVGVSPGRQKLKMWLLFFSVALLFVAMARPQWGFDWEEVHQQGLDIVVAIDTSKSMLAEDVVPNRLARAKLAVFDLMKLARTDRLGLIAFAGTAFLQCPLTVDEGAFRQSVEALDVNIIPHGGSAVGEAIETAISAFEKSGENHKILVLFTDGEDHDSGAVAAAQKAARAGMKVFTVGVGTPEGEMLRVRDQAGKQVYLKDDEGNAIRSRLNENLLREVATAGGGFYMPLQGATPMETLYSRGLATLPKAETTTRLVKNYRERYQWPLAAALALLIAELFIPDRKRTRENGSANGSRTQRAAMSAVFLLLLAPVMAVASPGKAQRHYELGQFQESLAEYERLLQRKTNDFRLYYNAGDAAYRAQEFSRAQRFFESALGAQDLKLQQQAYYNLGNTLFQSGETTPDANERKSAWENAIKSYEASLKLKPDDEDARHNLEFVRRKLEELKQQQQQQQQQQQNQDGQDQDSEEQENKQEQEKAGNDEKKPDQRQAGNQDQQDERRSQEEQQQQQQQQQHDQAQSKEQQDQQQQQQASQPKPGDREQGKESAEAQEGAISQMTVQQALQFLEAQKQQEKTLIFAPPPKEKAPGRPVKDW